MKLHGKDHMMDETSYRRNERDEIEELAPQGPGPEEKIWLRSEVERIRRDVETILQAIAVRRGE